MKTLTIQDAQLSTAQVDPDDEGQKELLERVKGCPRKVMSLGREAFGYLRRATGPESEALDENKRAELRRRAVQCVEAAQALGWELTGLDEFDAPGKAKAATKKAAATPDTTEG